MEKQSPVCISVCSYVAPPLVEAAVRESAGMTLDFPLKLEVFLIAPSQLWEIESFGTSTKKDYGESCRNKDRLTVNNINGETTCQFSALEHGERIRMNKTAQPAISLVAAAVGRATGATLSEQQLASNTGGEKVIAEFFCDKTVHFDKKSRTNVDRDAEKIPTTKWPVSNRRRLCAALPSFSFGDQIGPIPFCTLKCGTAGTDAFAAGKKHDSHSDSNFVSAMPMTKLMALRAKSCALEQRDERLSASHKSMLNHEHPIEFVADKPFFIGVRVLQSEVKSDDAVSRSNMNHQKSLEPGSILFAGCVARPEFDSQTLITTSGSVEEMKKNNETLASKHYHQNGACVFPKEGNEDTCEEMERGCSRERRKMLWEDLGRDPTCSCCKRSIRDCRFIVVAGRVGQKYEEFLRDSESAPGSACKFDGDGIDYSEMLRILKSFSNEPSFCATCFLQRPDPFLLTNPETHEICRSVLFSQHIDSPSSRRFYVFNRKFFSDKNYYCKNENAEEYKAAEEIAFVISNSCKISPLPPILYSRNKRLETRWLYRSLFGELVFIDSSDQRRMLSSYEVNRERPLPSLGYTARLPQNV